MKKLFFICLVVCAAMRLQCANTEDDFLPIHVLSSALIGENIPQVIRGYDDAVDKWEYAQLYSSVVEAYIAGSFTEGLDGLFHFPELECGVQKKTYYKKPVKDIIKILECFITEKKSKADTALNLSIVVSEEKTLKKKLFYYPHERLELQLVRLKMFHTESCEQGASKAVKKIQEKSAMLKNCISDNEVDWKMLGISEESALGLESKSSLGSFIESLGNQSNIKPAKR